MMRKVISFIFLMAVLVLSLGFSSGTSFAQTSDPDAEILADPDVFTFEELGYAERFMVGPYDNLDLYFSIPANWKLAAGTYVSFDVSFTLGGASRSDAFTDPSWVAGSLSVRFNNSLLGNVLLTQAEGATYQLLVPIEAFPTDTDDGRHSIRIFLDASMHCDDEFVDTIVWIEPDSFVKFVYDEQVPTQDLAEFPRPYFMADSILPSSSAIIIPDNPTSAEIEAGLAVSAGLGSLSGGEALVSLHTFSSVTQTIREDNHLIYVGGPDKFPDIQGLGFPVELFDGELELTGDVGDNGIVQSIQSPWNPVRSLLYVGGTDEESVVKAAKAVSGGKLITSGIPNLSLIRDVTATEATETSAIDQTFGGLGYSTATIGLYGDTYYEVLFNATGEQSKSEGAYLNVVSTRSNLIDFDKSGVTLILNDEVIGTLGYEETDPMLVEQQIDILPNYLRRGQNRLEIITSILPHDFCYTADLEAAWVTISDTSVLHMPVSQRTTEIGDRIDFIQYPLMFLGNREFNNLAFVLPQDSADVMTAASQVAFYLGSEEALTMAGIEVYFPDEVTDELLAEKNLIFIGRASQFPQIEAISDSLPVGFESGGDRALEPSLPVSFSVLPDVAVGYVELLDNPWNPERSMLMLMGNADAGVLMAADAVSVQTFISQLIGNYVSVHGAEILSIDTRLTSSEPVIVPDTPADSGGEDGGGEDSGDEPGPVGVVQEERPAWLIPTILGTSGAILLIILISAIRGRRARR